MSPAASSSHSFSLHLKYTTYTHIIVVAVAVTLLILPLSDGASAVGSEESGEKLCVVSMHTLSIDSVL